MKISTKILLGFIAIGLIAIISNISLSFFISRQYKHTMLEKAKAITADHVIRNANRHLTPLDFQGQNYKRSSPFFS